MPQFLIPPGYQVGETVELAQDESHHIRNVFRLQRGAAVRLFDGQAAFLGRIDEVGVKVVTVYLEKKLASSQNPRPIILYQALLKGEKMEWVLQKSTELGVDEIHPFTSERTVVKLTGKDKTERWQKICDQAVKQCGRDNRPIVNPTMTFVEVLKELQDQSAILCWEGTPAVPIREIFNTPSEKPLCILIGPEGGFSQNEVTQAKATGCLVVTLGAQTLRAETAALVALAIVHYEISRGET